MAMNSVESILAPAERIGAIKIGKTGNLENQLAPVQLEERFDWNDMSGEYSNIISSPHAKASIMQLDPMSGIETVVALLLGAKSPTFESSGRLFYKSNGNQRRSEDRLDSIDLGTVILRIKPDTKIVESGGHTIDLSGKRLLYSERIVSIGRKHDQGSSQTSIRATFSDENGTNRISLVYIQDIHGKELVDSRLYLSSGNGPQLDKNTNKDPLLLMLTVDMYHSKRLGQSAPTITDYTQVLNGDR